MLVAGFWWGAAAHAVGTAAGTAVANQAEISYTIGADSRVRSSNVSTFLVAEVVDLNLLLQTPERLVSGGDVNQPLYFTLTNTGNGTEAYALNVVTGITGDAFDPELPAVMLVLDSDGSGDLSSGDDNYVPGINDPSLGPNGSVGLFLLADIPAGLPDGALGLVRLEAAAVTGSGAAGTLFAGLGDAGVDALIGPSGGFGSATGEYLVSEVELLVSKSAALRSASGDASAVPAAEITYTIQVAASGTGTALDADLRDPIPANTTYVPGSLRLNGVALTDAVDTDEGDFSEAESQVSVRLGDLSPADALQVVEFTVTIN
jgi:uncharacterized repeat protein (TIGR01451 family)